MKRIYTFNVKKVETIKEEVSSKNDAGEEVITKKDVTKETDHEFFIRQPSRSITEEGALYYSSEVAKGIKRGLMSEVVLRKRYVNDGGIYSEEEKKQIDELEVELAALQEENEQISRKDKKTEDDEERLKEINEKLIVAGKKLTNMVSYEQAIYSNTAESFARNKTILYWIMFLSYQVVDGREVPFFSTGSLDERIEKYDEYSESDDSFIQEVAKKFTYLVSAWAMNSSLEKEDFDEALKLYKSEEA